MAVVSSDYLAGLLTNFRTIFEKDFKAAMALQAWTDISMRIPSDTEIESYNWFGTVPVMAEGQPVLGGLEHYNFSIKSKTWKAGLEVKRETIEDDKIGLLSPRLAQLGPEAARHPGQLILSLFELNPLAYDGKAFFATNHVIGNSGTINNFIQGDGVDTVAHVQTSIEKGRAQMVLFKDDQGRVMGNRPNVIVVPVGKFQIFYQALNANQGSINQPILPADGTGRFSAGGYVVVENPLLTDDGNFYMLHVEPGIRPFIFQDRLAPAMEGITTPTTESGILLDRFIYTVRARYNVGVGDFTSAVCVYDD